MRIDNMHPVAVWDDDAGDGYMWQGDRATSLSSGNLNFKILEKPESSTHAQGLMQRRGCISLKSDQVDGEAFYFGQGLARTQSNLSADAHKQTNILQVVSTEGMSIGDDIKIGSDGGRIINIDSTTKTIEINVNLANDYLLGLGPVHPLVETTYRTKTTLRNGVTANATQITVQPDSGLEVGDKIRVGTDEAKIASPVPGDPNTFNIFSFSSNGLSAHAAGTLVTWLQYPNIAYANHRVAPWYGEPVPAFSSGSDTWRMKRVIGMTRATGTTEELDGSWLTSTFTDGKVKKSGNNTLLDWVADDVDQSPTGYDATGSGAEALDQRSSTKAHPLDAKQLKGGEPVKDLSKTKVEFPSLTVVVTNATTLRPHKAGETLRGKDANLAGRKDTHDSRLAKQGGASRYTTETVNINLRQYAGKKASGVKPTK